MMTASPEADFSFEDGVITGYSGSGGEVVIPATIGGQAVTAIGARAFSFRSSLTSIVIPEGVTSIGFYAFEGCSSLASITLPSTLATIEGNPFAGCRSLSDLSIASGNNSFVVEGDVLYDTSKTRAIVGLAPIVTSVVLPETVATIEDRAFHGSSLLTSIVIPEGVTSIGFDAFLDCTALTSITLPSTLTSIGSYAFSYCSSMTSIVIPEGVTRVGNSAFSGCSSLTTISLPSTLTSIGSSAFWGCYALTSIDIPEGVTSIGSQAFWGCYALTSIDIPEGVTSIGFYAFGGCSALTSITLPSTLATLASNPFIGCLNLSDLTIAPSNTSFVIEHGVIYDAAKTKVIAALSNVVTSVVLPGTVTTIGSYAFGGCSALTSITLPSTLNSIGGRAFYYCSSLTSIVIPESVTSIGSDAFNYCRSLQAAIFLTNFIDLPAFYPTDSDFIVYFDQSRQGWSAGASSRPGLDIRPLDLELGGIVLSVNGDKELVLGLDSAMSVRDSITGEINAITKDGASVTTALWNRWAISEVAEFSGNRMLFARDITTGHTHRIHVTANWEVGGVFDSVANNFSEYLPRSARGDAVEPGVVDPFVPADIRIPIDLGGNTKLHRSFSGELFANGGLLLSSGQTGPVRINSEPGFRAIAAESLESNRLLFQSVEGRVVVWEFGVDWDQGVHRNDAVASEFDFLIDINRDQIVDRPPNALLLAY